MRFDLTCSTDDNYVQHCMAMLCSVLENNRNHDIFIHLLHHGLSQNGQQLISNMVLRYGAKIRYYDVDVDRLSSFSIAEYHPNLSIATYFRFFLPSFLDSSIKKVLYLDCDVIVLKDVSELFHIDLAGYGVAGVKDVTPNSDKHRQVMGLELDDRAFCAGVLMINLEYWRLNNSEERLFKYASEMNGKLIMEDQDVLNYEFKRHWFQLPYKYSYTPMSIAPLDISQKWADIFEYVSSPSIIHYAAHVKPWLDIRIPDDQYYWKYVKISEYPTPTITHCQERYRNAIRITKVRYYLNYYLRPFIPHIFEILIKDIAGIFILFSYALGRKDFKAYRLKKWLEKYNFLN
ncbi:glycosyl transferase, family 8 [Prevotella intermedia]|uniref:Glycosyl transferase, family 8 n=1 Tax=Prevotella intermedia TaxID=28131 RepID=A0AAD1BJI7_PREIN|nr:glycosyltransferase family 8 protein [Prevotella intermedia]APW34459.1 glycosyl transferase [Prevotella intermedia]BAR95861.1 glycosyl transferase, family 8 [Prevotella intermedia]